MTTDWTPESVGFGRQLGTRLLNAGTDTGPAQHWTQALARVLQAGSGAAWTQQANEGERAGNQAVADIYKRGMESGMPMNQMAGALMATPFGMQRGQQLADSYLNTSMNQGFQREQQNRQFGHAERMQNAQFGQQRSMAQEAHQLQLKLMQAKSQMERDQLLSQARTLGLIAPQAGPGQPPGAMPAPAITAPSAMPADQGSFDIPDARAPLPGPTPEPAPAAVPSAQPTPPARGMSPIGEIEEERRNRAAIALILGNKDTATKILTESPDREGQKAYDSELGKGLAKEMGELRDGARKAQSQLAMLDVMENLIASGTPLGPGTQYELALRRALGAAGIQTNGLSQAEMFQALASQLALAARDPSGGAGMPGAMSDSDRQFLVGMNPNLSMTPEGNRMLIGYMKRVAQRSIEVARFANEYARMNKGRIDDRFFDRLAQWSAQNPLFPEAAATQAQGGQRQPAGAASGQPAGQPAQTQFATPDQIPEGARVFDQATGQRLIKRGSQLVPFVEQTGPTSAPGSPAARAQERRATMERESNAASDQLRAQFERDAASLPPIDVVRKYDGQRGSLSGDQLRRLDELLTRATRGNR
jgi:hypothetical protein